MPEFRLVISDPKTGKAQQITVSDVKANALVGLKIGDIIDGSLFNYQNAKLMITGGSDKSGFPMHPRLQGGGKYKILASNGFGFHSEKKGLRKRKLFRGNTVTEDIVQINMKILYPEEPDIK
ncbi:MAG: 30S ribosomal protein S6e [Candidatus Methanomethylicia archaeon]